MNHDEMYDVSILELSKMFEIDQHGPNLQDLKSGQVLFYCKQSGCLIRVYTLKGLFCVLVFPDSRSKQIRFIKTDKKCLLGLGYDVPAIDSVLHPSVNNGMGSGTQLKVRLQSIVLSETSTAE